MPPSGARACRPLQRGSGRAPIPREESSLASRSFLLDRLELSLDRRNGAGAERARRRAVLAPRLAAVLDLFEFQIERNGSVFLHGFSSTALVHAASIIERLRVSGPERGTL